jgi:hypothetical protein
MLRVKSSGESMLMEASVIDGATVLVETTMIVGATVLGGAWCSEVDPQSVGDMGLRNRTVAFSSFTVEGGFLCHASRID